jgi:hypothetical protein
MNLADVLSILTLRKIVLTVAGLFSGSILLLILTLLLGSSLAKNVVRSVRWKDTARRVALAAFMSTIGFVAAVVHLYIFDKRFLSLSSMRVLKQKGKT